MKRDDGGPSFRNFEKSVTITGGSQNEPRDRDVFWLLRVLAALTVTFQMKRDDLGGSFCDTWVRDNLHSDPNYDAVPKIVTFQTKRDDLKLRSLDRDISNETWRSQVSTSWLVKYNVTISGSDLEIVTFQTKRDDLRFWDRDISNETWRSRIPTLIWGVTISAQNQIIRFLFDMCHMSQLRDQDHKLHRMLVNVTNSGVTKWTP